MNGRRQKTLRLYNFHDKGRIGIRGQIADSEGIRYYRRVRIVFRMAVRALRQLAVKAHSALEPQTQPKRLLIYMYAVIETGGKQYRVVPGQIIQVDTIAGDVGADVEFDRILALSNDSNELVFGDALKSARVKGKIASHGRGDKILVFKFKRKKQYKRTIGHRQNFTRVEVQEILA